MKKAKPPAAQTASTSAATAPNALYYPPPPAGYYPTAPTNSYPMAMYNPQSGYAFHIRTITLRMSRPNWGKTGCDGEHGHCGSSVPCLRASGSAIWVPVGGGGGGGSLGRGPSKGTDHSGIIRPNQDMTVGV
jgi:hypothetical protein